jgi:hypothetical protein
VVTIGLHHAASFVGVLMTIQGVGAVIGGLTAAALLKRVSEGMLIAIALSFASAAVLLLTLPDIVTAVAGMVLAGLVGPWVAVAATTAIQRRTPAPLIGRVSGAFGLSLTIPQVVSIGFGATLIAFVSYRLLLVAVAAVAMAAVSFLLSQPVTRHRTAEMAAAAADAGPDAARPGPDTVIA